MKAVQYATTTPATAVENERLVRAVFEELHRDQPPGIRYAVLRLADGRFIHIVEQHESARTLMSVAAFNEFQTNLRARISGAPVALEASLIGNYKVFEGGVDGGK